MLQAGECGDELSALQRDTGDVCRSALARPSRSQPHSISKEAGNNFETSCARFRESSRSRYAASALEKTLDGRTNRLLASCDLHLRIRSARTTGPHRFRESRRNSFVRDSAGNQSFVDGAKVKLNGPATLETETDGKGSYVFTAVPLGTYTLEAVSAGLEARQTVCISATEILVPLELKPREVSSSVVVRADEAGSKEPAPSETISEKTLRDAPNVNERFESALPLIPGVVRGPDGHINLKRTHNTQSGALVNSANVTDPVTGSPAINLPIDVVQSVEVISNPYDPQYGRFTGAVSTIATKTSNFDNFHYSVQNVVPRLRERAGTTGNLWTGKAVAFAEIDTKTDPNWANWATRGFKTSCVLPLVSRDQVL
jgi:hypothetical protein